MSHRHNTGPKSWIVSDEHTDASFEAIVAAEPGLRHFIDSITIVIVNNTVEIGYGGTTSVGHVLIHAAAPASVGVSLSHTFKRAVPLPVNKSLSIKGSGSANYSYIIEGHTDV